MEIDILQRDRTASHQLLTITTRGLNENMTATSPYVRPFQDEAITFTGVFIFFLFFVGILMNLLTILVILKYPQIRNVFMCFIFSLCISDLISALISPLFWYRRTLGFDDWKIPNFFCKFFWATDISTSFATAVHIMSFGFMRYVSIKFPFCFHNFTNKKGIVLIAFIWITSFACGFVPFYIFFGARERDRHSTTLESRWPSCTINAEWHDAYTKFQKIAYPIFFYIPIVSVIFVSILISIEVHSSSRSAVVKSANRRAFNMRKRKDKQAVLQLVLIVASFIIGYIPYTVYEYWSVQDHPHTNYYKRLDYWLGFSEYFLIRISECLNPIFYNLGSSRMRRYMMKYIKEELCCGNKRNNNNQRRQSAIITTITSDLHRKIHLPVCKP